ncbi:MAG: cytochrome c [Candidatus Omnitrophica bacterium]|nr:cytochrome c [Candidatus Omnitrophota bacterium]
MSTNADAIEGDVARGKVLYKKECTLCHGAAGKGDGPAAPFVVPKPRDFTKGIFKIRSTPFLPTDRDLFETISGGMPGTLMPSFTYLSVKERQALVAYVRSLSRKFEEAGPLEPIVIPEPPPRTTELIATGKQLYKDYGCMQCHGPEGKGDGPTAATLTDDWGDTILPYDFTIPGKMKGGSTMKNVYRALAVGIGGTPMPAYGEPETKETENAYWALAAYVLSLTGKAPPGPPAGDSIIGKDLFTGRQRFKSGAAPCMACHSVSGIGALGGGVLGPDLTPAYAKFGDEGLATILTELPFPTMRAVLSEDPFTPDEQSHVIRFFQAASVTQRPPEVVGRLAGLALGGAVIVLLLTHVLWRGRLTGVRRSIVEQQSED